MLERPEEHGSRWWVWVWVCIDGPGLWLGSLLLLILSLLITTIILSCHSFTPAFTLFYCIYLALCCVKAIHPMYNNSTIITYSLCLKWRDIKRCSLTLKQCHRISETTTSNSYIQRMEYIIYSWRTHITNRPGTSNTVSGSTSSSPWII